MRFPYATTFSHKNQAPYAPYEGDVITEVLKDARLKSDPIHPNAAGYHVIAERVAAALKKNGAL